MSEYNRHKWAMEWMHGGGRDPNGRGLDEEIQIANDMWKQSTQPEMHGVPQEWDELSPQEEQYYQKPPFSTNEVFLGSKGGTPQLVQPGRMEFKRGRIVPPKTHEYNIHEIKKLKPDFLGKFNNKLVYQKNMDDVFEIYQKFIRIHIFRSRFF